MSYTIEDLKRDLAKKYFNKLSPAEQQEVIQSLPPDNRRKIRESLPPEEHRETVESLPLEERRKVVESLPLEERLAGLNQEQVREFFERSAPAEPRKPRRKK